LPGRTVEEDDQSLKQCRAEVDPQPGYALGVCMTLKL
jgi:hypothetical protein